MQQQTCKAIRIKLMAFSFWDHKKKSHKNVAL